ncbi:MAG: acetamidase/formamidase family protein [Candidatus Thermoplasmatota archaeon]|jgi:acetamidase/formamidase|nr:acetamidase/formamidase family protein [Candidatus Thermoplasmatota archaeon]MCL5791114.1 acetamidase/formamidase family protein [Candidatus Thermoplasmatota archaeon]
MIDGNLKENLHFKWTSSNKPIAKTEEEEVVRIKIPDSSINQIKRGMSSSDLSKIDPSLFDGAVGPIYIAGSEPGDSIEIEILDIKSGNEGWSAIINDFGLLKNRYGERVITWSKIENFWRCDDEEFLRGIKIPDVPFLGVIGTSPSEGEYGMIPPQHFGGNMDNRMIGIGSRIILPVNVEGAMVSFGDPHGHQGDGEICGTAIETDMEIDVRFKILRKRTNSPVIFSQDTVKGDFVFTSGISNDLHNASVEAVESMISYLCEFGFSEEESYILLSVAGNLSIREIVDEPNFVVNMGLDRKIIGMRSNENHF